ncbi:MAG: YfcE family phosphodiesterase [Gammaproteobacteria bacterium]|nr:MAG: YfcE family phosphodiesterase [Gammaproteobacteria bacterium]
MKIDIQNDDILIGVLSDTHGFLNGDVFDALQGCDIILHAGDIMGSHIIQKLTKITKKVYGVSGNNDCNQYPQKIDINLKNYGTITTVHGDSFDFFAPDHQDLRDAYPKSKIIIYGHTHKKIIDDSKNPIVLNPGAAGKTRIQSGPSCLTLKIKKSKQLKISSFRF